MSSSARGAEVKLVLGGDRAPLGAVEADGLLRLLAEVRGVELRTVRRLTPP